MAAFLGHLTNAKRNTNIDYQIILLWGTLQSGMGSEN